jgi:ribosomal protein L27
MGVDRGITQTNREFWEALQVIAGEDSSGNLNIADIDPNGALLVRAALAVGIEITGVKVDVDQVTVSATGDQDLVTVTSSQTLRVTKVTVNVDDNVTGNILLKLGGTVKVESQNLIVGGDHVLFDAGDGYMEGAADADLEANIPASVTAEFTIYYKKVAV